MNQKRINRVLEQMKEEGCDHLLITDPTSIDYLIDYYNDPHERVYVMALSQDGNHRLFFNKLFYVEKDLGIDITWFSDTDDAMAMIKDYLKDAKKVGVDKDMPARWLLPLMKLDTQFVLGSSCVDYVRGIKDEEEQEIMIKASQINDQAMARVKELLKENHTEKEMDGLLLNIYHELGASDHSFEPIFGYGKNGADPHHVGDDSRLKEGDSIIVDMGCIYNGYCSDMTRTFFYKSVSEKQKDVYNLVLKAQLAAEAAIKPGLKLSDIDKVARDIISEAGYGEEFNHRLGHFIGRLTHEAGDVSSANDAIIKPGMIFSIEPGVYLPGEFGVRIEDLVLVTEDGCKVLNHYPKELMILE